MNRINLVSAITLMLLLFCSLPAAGEEIIGSGLEADNYKKVTIWVKSLDNEAKKLGLNSTDIEKRVAAKLEAGGLEPDLKRILAINIVDTCLYVSIIVSGEAVNISVDFKRYGTYYTSGKKEYKTQITTWGESMLGSASSAADILAFGLDPLVDKFIASYTVVNEKK